MNNQEAENNRKVHDFIKAHPCATLATHGTQGAINLANVFVYVDHNFFFYIVSRPEHRKHANIKNDPKVTLLFTDEAGVAQAECIGTGATVEQITSVADILPDIQSVLIEQKSQYWIPPVSQLEADGYVVIKIVPDSVVYRSYSPDGTTADLEEISVVLEGTI